MQQRVFFVGTKAEIEHHAAPLRQSMDFQIVEPELVVQRARPGDLTVFFTEHFDRFRDAIQSLKEKQVATLYMIDGIIEWRNAWENSTDEPACPFAMRPILAHKAACIGSSQARILHSWGNSGKVEVVGIPRFDRLNPENVPTGKDRDFRFLVMTAKCPGYTEQQNQNLFRCLTDIKDHLQQLNGIEVVWRLTADWDRELGVPNQLTDLTGTELADLLPTVDAVVSTPSTAVLESMLLNVPTAIADYNNSPGYIQSPWHITAASHVADQIAGLMHPSPAKMVFQRQILAEQLYLDSSAADRMVQLITAMLVEGKQAIESGSSLVFATQLLSSVDHVGLGKSEFKHADLFPEHPEFAISDISHLQSQLAHSRREIRQLQSQMKQIQSELSQAHAIFDEINSHPIAGPIVKVRRKLSDLIKRIRRSNPHINPN